MEKARLSAIGDSAGYTLVELLVVLVVMALLVGAVPVMISAGRPGAQARAIAELFVSDMRIARMRAVLSGTDVVLVIDPDTARYSVQPGGPSRQFPNGTVLEVARLQGAQSSSNVVRFYSDGSAPEFRIHVGIGQHRYLVTSQPLTGRIAINE